MTNSMEIYVPTLRFCRIKIITIGNFEMHPLNTLWIQKFMIKQKISVGLYEPDNKRLSGTPQKVRGLQLSDGNEAKNFKMD